MLLKSRLDMRRIAKSISSKVQRKRRCPVSSLSLHMRCRNVAKDCVRRSCNKGCSPFYPPWIKGGHSTRKRTMGMWYQEGAASVHSRGNKSKVAATCPDWQATLSSFCWDHTPRKAWTVRLSRVCLEGCICGTRR